MPGHDGEIQCEPAGNDAHDHADVGLPSRRRCPPYEAKPADKRRIFFRERSPCGDIGVLLKFQRWHSWLTKYR